MGLSIFLHCEAENVAHLKHISHSSHFLTLRQCRRFINRFSYGGINEIVFCKMGPMYFTHIHISLCIITGNTYNENCYIKLLVLFVFYYYINNI